MYEPTFTIFIMMRCHGVSLGLMSLDRLCDPRMSAPDWDPGDPGHRGPDTGPGPGPVTHQLSATSPATTSPSSLHIERLSGSHGLTRAFIKTFLINIVKNFKLKALTFLEPTATLYCVYGTGKLFNRIQSLCSN